MATELHAADAEENGVATEAEGGVPTFSIPACRTDYRGHQSDPQGMGQLLLTYLRVIMIRGGQYVQAGQQGIL